jgi:hypothetical protein
MTKSDRLRRIYGTVLAAGCAWALVACATTVAGVAVKAREQTDADGATVALLDTGDYPTSPGPPFGPAGNATVGANMEAHRLAVNVVGPWQVDATYQPHGALANTVSTAPLPQAKSLKENYVLDDPLPAVAAAHGYITGFASFRAASNRKNLINGVLRFPDNSSADAAAHEMADKYPYGDLRPRPTPIGNHPEALSTNYDGPDGMTVAVSFSPHGPYVLMTGAVIADRNEAATAPTLIGLALDKQEPLTDKFAPTDPARMDLLPKDFTGQLLARTLWAPDNSAPLIVGVWERNAWLHFEDDPVKAAALFDSAGVDVVAQRIATVYQARDPAGAAQVVDHFAADLRARDGVVPITGVNGLPGARCFAWPNATQRLATADPPMSWLRVVWPYKCVARAGRYAFTAFSQREDDVKRRIAAQYRILAGT